MNVAPLSKTIANVMAGLIFWVVLLLSLLLRDELTIESILFDVAKALIVAGVGAFLLTIVSDALVRSMIVDAKEHRVDRFKGGLSYHVAPVSPEENQWRKNYDKKFPTMRKEVESALTSPKSKKK